MTDPKSDDGDGEYGDLACVSQWRYMGITPGHLFAQDLGICSDNLFSVRGHAGVPLDFLFAGGLTTILIHFTLLGDVQAFHQALSLPSSRRDRLSPWRVEERSETIMISLLNLSICVFYLKYSALDATDAIIFAQVDPSECVAKNTEGASVAIIDCPTLQHIPSLVSAAAKTRRPCKPSAGGKV